jgi:hypothetical protein
MGTQLPMRGELVLALSAFVQKLTKFCKPPHERQCVASGACGFVLLPSLVHPLPPVLSVMSVCALRAIRLGSSPLHHFVRWAGAPATQAKGEEEPEDPNAQGIGTDEPQYGQRSDSRKREEEHTEDDRGNAAQT